MEQKSVLVPVSDGFEEIETVSIVDVLRRGGAQVTLASIKPITNDYPIVLGSNGIKILCDTYLTEEIIKRNFDMIALPGGLKNAEALRDHEVLIMKLRGQIEEKRWLAAICASPALVLHTHGFLNGQEATCNPGFQEVLKGKQEIESRVVISNKIITSRSPGTAIEFALQLVAALFDQQKAMTLAKTMLVKL